MQATTIDLLVETLLARGSERRILVAMAGPPGVGKSTAAEALEHRLSAARPGCAAILPMDGFHFDDLVLEARGQRPRKGAPFTFDVDGLGVALQRLRADDGREVAVPVFDRSIEIARAGARIIPPGARFIIVEGNYLLLDQPPWTGLAALFDVTVMLDAPLALLLDRLHRRWTDIGLSPAAALEKVEANDAPNARLVMENSRAADFSLRTDATRPISP
ncbi:nucleoside/nucleotide kinase family protein [Mangrovicella endophytica]|uniref:nucleoside/nucleotide kinase family protein n=1 Tax=Mangrovicella endophytica TaxID=2066697 RepID=UPI000C9E037C|nr:nucleoside/nucleotide kinase family protein [Mangrovicella endophytica]